MGFRNGKNIKEYLVRVALPKTDNVGGSEPCGKGTCQVCDHIIITNTFTAKACGEVFKIQYGSLKWNSEKVLYLLRRKICDDTPYVGKAKTKFCLRFNNYKSKYHSFRKKKNRMYHRSVFFDTMFNISTEALMIGKKLYLRSVKHPNNL